jgi:putative tryptophan/tyrosine transport system substrate-binding protein
MAVAYVGGWPEASDKVYARFMQAVRQRHPELAARADFRHYEARTGDSAAIARALQQALAAHPTVLVAPTGEVAMMAAKLESRTPFVFASYTDPVARGIRDSLQFSSQANTGVFMRGSVDGKRLEILKDAVPGLRRVAILADRAWAGDSGGSARANAAALELGLHVGFVLADTSEELDARMSSPAAASYDAWYVPPTYLSYIAEKSIIAHLNRLKAPAMHSTASEVRAGALMAYEEDTSFAMDALANLAARVCQGERAGAIPVERPQRFTLTVRAPASRAEGPAVAATVIRRADAVIREN